MNTNILLSAHDVHKIFQVGTQDLMILRGVTTEVFAGDFAVIVGPSGCGKSTLLHVLMGLEEPTSGEVFYKNQDLYTNTSEDDRATFRKEHIGMIYQQPNWIKSMSVIENVSFPLLLLGTDPQQARETAEKLVEKVGMKDWIHHRPTELSGGQQQRVALARALANDPEVIVADEPTGNLDYQSGQEMMQLLAHLNSDLGKTIMMVTHDLEYMRFANTAINMLDGEITHHYKGDEIAQYASGMKTKRGVSGVSEEAYGSKTS